MKPPMTGTRTPPAQAGEKAPETWTKTATAQIDINEEVEAMMNATPFEGWLLDNISDILHVQREVLSGPLSKGNNPEEMKEAAMDAEGWFSRMTTLLAEANAHLDVAEKTNKSEKVKGETDFDRQIDLASRCAVQRKLRDIVKGLCDGIEQRISLAQTLISYEKQSIYGSKEGRG